MKKPTLWRWLIPALISVYFIYRMMAALVKATGSSEGPEAKLLLGFTFYFVFALFAGFLAWKRYSQWSKDR